VESEKAEEIKRLMTEARADTLELLDLAHESELHESPGFGFRPIIWHLAHIGVFEAYWLLQKLEGRETLDERYESIFDPIRTPRESSKNLPTRNEMESYLERVRSEVWRVLDGVNFEGEDPLLNNAYIFHLVLQHEYQHQETLCYLFHLLDPQKKRHTGAQTAATGGPALLTGRNDYAPGDMIPVPAGAFQMGAVWNEFAYDNELPAHEVHVPAFKIARCPVTNEEYASFIAEGGYKRREFWSEEGGAHREQEGWDAPLYWRREGAGWRERAMFEEAEMRPRHPVTGISWYEAEAYARFAGKRLPTEAEWEKAASWDEGKKRRLRFAFGDRVPAGGQVANFGSRFWGTTPVGTFPEGASPYGCLDMTGNVWEWTGDKFEGYAGFKPFPYPEYSEEWFDGDHRVLRGGSWATRAPLLRTSFRNFFRSHFRIAFAGIRLAE
jgi:gamma-glutamyl hercynylcysteine S-oxide synthase